jgi:hypothetical protein
VRENKLTTVETIQMATNAQTIFTLNARGNVILEVTKEYFSLSDEHMLRAIVDSHKRAVELLAQKRIDYANLKSALVPNPKRNEIALVFDSSRTESSWYGYEVIRRILPLFEKGSNHSVLCGDLIGGNHLQHELRNRLRQELSAVREYEYRHSSLFYLVYINNLSDNMASTFIDGLRPYEAFIGSINFNYFSFLKGFVSMLLPSIFIKHRNVVIQPHSDDLNDTENENLSGLPFEEFGFQNISIASTYYGMFLEYKIECPAFENFRSDTLMSLNAISSKPSPLSDFDIELDERKLQYLVEAHGSSLKRAGLRGLNRDEIVAAIRERIQSNYIFNLSFDARFEVAKFNIILEFATVQDGPFKALLSVEYKANEKLLRVLTMY